jgi:hypothetical protein
MVEIEAPPGMQWNSGWFRSSAFLSSARPATDIWFSVDSAFFEQVKSSLVKVHISFALAAFPAKETRRITAADGEFAVLGGALCAIDQDGSSALQCRSPMTRPFLVASTLSDETTCPPGEDEKAAPPGTAFSGVNWNWNRKSTPAELGISPVKLFDLALSRGSRTRDDLQARLCPGTPLTFSVPEETKRTRSELNIDGLRLGDYQLPRISSRGGSATGIGIGLN